MTFSSTLQLRLFGGHHSLDSKMSSPRDFRDRDGDNADLKLSCSISSDGKWPSLKGDDGGLESTSTSNGYSIASSMSMLQSTESSGPGFQSNGLNGLVTTIPVGSTTRNGALNHSDWNMISSNSFDDSCLEGDYTNCGLSLVSSSFPSITNLNEPMNKLALENEGHNLPVMSMPYPGTSWFMSSKVENGSNNALAFPSFGTPRTQPLNTQSMEPGSGISFRTPCIYSGPPDFTTTSGKVSGDGISSYSCDVTSPVQMDNFAVCLPQTLEPSELLFDDMNSWTGGSTDTYATQPYHHHHQSSQPYSTVSMHPTTSIGFPYFEATSSTTTSAMPTSNHAYTLPYPRHPALSNTATPHYRAIKYGDVCSPTESRTMDHVRRYLNSSSAYATLNGDGKVSGFHVDHENDRLSAPESPRSAEPVESLPRSSPCSQDMDVHLDPSGSVLEAADSIAGVVKTVTPYVTPNQSARIQLLTALSDCYWKNGRKNLQCFPSCPEHHDFYSMKMNNRKHSSVGVCRGPVYCHAFTNASEFFLPTQSTKRDGASRGANSAREIFVLGRFERVPQQESTNLLEELNPSPTFPNALVFEQFRFTCFQAVEMEERRVLLPDSPPVPSSDMSLAPNESSSSRFIRSTWFFLPDVWKVQPMLKKKRKATRSAPAQTFPFCFRIFIYTRDLDGPGYSCIADTASTFFELYSTRTVDRVKRKYWSNGTPSRSTTERSTKQRGM